MNFSQFVIYSQDIINDHVFVMETKGFNLFKNFFSNDLCDSLRVKIETAIDSYKPVDNSPRSVLDKYHMHDLLCKDVLFAKMLEDPRLNQIVASLLGESWIVYAHTSSSLPPNGDNYGARIHVDSPRHISNYPTNVGVIWALDDFTLDNGATHILSGSHNTKIVPSKEIFEKHSERVVCKKGSLIIFNARTWHKSGENKTNKFRHALTMNVCRPYMKQRMDWVRFIPESITSQLNEQARRIIGFDTRIPTNLEEFFQPEEKRLYKGEQE